MGQTPMVESGTVAAIEGQAEVSRAGTWTPLALGDRLSAGDRIRTRRPGRLRLVFEDDTVLIVGDDTEISVAAALFDPGAPGLRSIFGLVRGKLRALVSDAYAKRGAKFEIETVTATVGVRGTEFVIVYDPVAEVTDAVGVNGTTEVHSVLDRVGQAVFVTDHELTQVYRGSYPTPLRKLDETTFRQYLDGLEFIGGGEDESATIGDLILSGGTVEQSESADNAFTREMFHQGLQALMRRQRPSCTSSASSARATRCF